MTWRGLFTSFFSVSLFALFCSTFIISDAGAVSDITLTSTYSNGTFPSVGYLCSSSGTPAYCSDFSYLLIELSSSINEQFSVGILNDSIYVNLPPFSSFVLYHYSNFRSFGFGGISKSGFNDGDTITFTLSDHNPFSASVSGSLSITNNGTYDVSSYAQAVVNVPPTVIDGDYHDDLVSINNTIMIGCAVPLVIYFFYGIYKMILGGLK